MSLFARHMEIDPKLAASRRLLNISPAVEAKHFAICMTIFIAMTTMVALIMFWYTRKYVLGSASEVEYARKHMYNGRDPSALIESATAALEAETQLAAAAAAAPKAHAQSAVASASATATTSTAQAKPERVASIFGDGIRSRSAVGEPAHAIELTSLVS